MQKSDLEPSKLEVPPEWPAEVGPYLVSVRLDLRRNFAGWPFTPMLSAAARAEVERAGQSFLDVLEAEQVAHWPEKSLGTPSLPDRTLSAPRPS